MSGRPVWRRLETGARSAAWNMACDAALLDRVGAGASPPTFRLYGWNPPAVSIGRHQPPPGDRARSALADRGIDWVRRPTGGRAVWHAAAGRELTYAVVAPRGAPPLAGGLVDVYRQIHEALAEGLASLGIDVGLARRVRGVRPAGPTRRTACFAATVPWEIEAGGRKLVGSAQCRGRRAFLQHGSIPLAGDQAPLLAAWPGCLPPGSATTVSAAAGRDVGPADVAAALATSMAGVLGLDLAPAGLSPEERVEIEARIQPATGGIDSLDTPSRARRYSVPSSS